MKHQLIAGAGLAAIMAFCGYMVAQLAPENTDATSPPTFATP
jgi:hypothetical protein